jgi:hypothetical protein
MKDFLGKELCVGSEVVIIAPGYRMFVKAIVIGFTKQKVKLKYTNDWNYSSNPMTYDILQNPNQVVIVNVIGLLE